MSTVITSAEAEIVLDPGARDGFGSRPDIERGIEAAGDAFDDHHGLLQQDQFRPRFHVEDVGVGKQLAEQVGHGNLVGLAAMDGLADGTHGLGEYFDLVMGQYVAGVEMHLGCAAVIAGDEAVQDFG